MDTFNFTEVKSLLSTKKRIVLTSHTNPDGDAIGSVLAMYHFLIQMDHEVQMIVPNPYPDFLTWMPGQEKIMIYQSNKEECEQLMENAEILFSLDYNAPARLKDAAMAFEQAQGIKILIDHHIQPKEEFYDYVYSTVDTSSTCELVYEFLVSINPGLLNKSIAENLYVGIITDTGSFSYACNSEKTFRIVSELYKLGIDGVAINRLVYSNNTEGRLRLLGYALSEKLVVLEKYATAYISLTKKELKSFNYREGDTEGLVNYALSIKGIRFAVLFSERPKKIRLSLRSVGEFSVNQIARDHYKGGGHKNAAGGDSFLSMEKTLENFERLLVEHKDLLAK